MSTYIISFKFESEDDASATDFAENTVMLANKLQAESHSNSVSDLGVAFTKLEEEVAGE